MKYAQMTTALRELNVSFKAVNVIGIFMEFCYEEKCLFLLSMIEYSLHLK